MDLAALFVSAFVTLFVVLDPPGCVPIFSSLTSGASAAHRRAMALRSTAIASVVLVLFGAVGEAFLASLGISLAAFRIA
ncbi:MAG: MarC family protein, partial [Sphingomonadaceae bacterium]|nr:MarC family protein [Sphingomonadaceae bacterium]